MCTDILPEYLSVQHRPAGDKRRALDQLEPECPMVVSCLVGFGN